MLKEKVTALLQEAFEEYENLFLIDLKIKGNNEIVVVIDGDQGVTVQDCINVSRKVEHNLDREEEDFSLEVMSAGATEPLINTRQYKKNEGRDLEVVLQDGSKITGNLIQVHDEGIVLFWKERVPKEVGKGKMTVEKEEVIAFDAIKQAKVKIKF
ncbi:MAG TPA: ribosome assembly cofactor RimP [Leeuwenhoekiella sp.]|uniref:ribosome assembly cofactor RimP n=1 Tax=Leeuwenhoekiella palythoae TaxID=573501 RepID=UPI000E8D97E6|nr:ribosome assembly cofactor RimP [Leeuwenhoekiella palythoae]UBZ11552.1 ribosome assembly cofactor RimP [Leeuwenhoekiella palythoae]HAX15860.1 ribosome assembly cofactor RimP [Leeuwenhoekiella sp.]HBO29978.1 ribosome assembly cofactor RimP [Leeuwenhoekiella sp.]HCQ76098.1 ribosome assembly cofactor RimP [Leeuwenhoekiella sp.]|tara:strand:+ start:1098 stop:1562 length:465 start_codon:yes stop_codon:yes gene_type:complete